MTSASRLSLNEIAAYLKECPAEVCELVLVLRDVVMKTAPGAAEAIKFHSLCYFLPDCPYGAIGGNVCTIDGRSGVCGLGLFRGRRFPILKGC